MSMQHSIGSMSYSENAGKGNTSRRQQFAVDFAYTLNHALICTLTDPITDVPVGATVQNTLAAIRGSGNKVTVSEVLHGLSPNHIAGHFKSAMTFRKAEGERFSPATSWLVGEVAGDFGAVPVVVALQHYAPGLMSSIGKLASPVAKPFFRRAAERSAKAECKLAGEEASGPAFDKRVDELCQRELDNLPKAIMWTGVSPAINILMQKTVMGNKAPVSDLLLGKGLGAVVTSATTVGLRNISPAKAQKWDDILSEKTGKPVAGFVSKLLGVDRDTLKSGMDAKRQEDTPASSWTSRTEPTDTQGRER
jgi:hypothetical protein